MNVPDVAEQNIQMWKTKKLIKSLDSARGYGSSDAAMGLITMDLQSWNVHDQSHHPTKGAQDLLTAPYDYS